MTEDQILPMDGGDVPDDALVRDRLRAAYRNTPAPDDGMLSRCIRVVTERAAGEGAAAARTNTSTPAFARRHWVFAAAAMAAALLITVTVRSRVAPEQADIASGTDGAPVGSTKAFAGGVQFDLKLPINTAANVSLVGDFNGWDAKATPMVKDASGEWSAKVTLLPGRHVYAYVVNGEQWVVDPLAPQIPDAGYGPANAVVVEGDTK